LEQIEITVYEKLSTGFRWNRDKRIEDLTKTERTFARKCWTEILALGYYLQ